MTKRAPRNDVQKEAIAEMRERGLSYGVIAQQLNLSHGAVSWYCLVAGIESPKLAAKVPAKNQPLVCYRGGQPVRRFTDIEDRQLLELEARGLGYNQIAKAMNRRHNTIRGRLATLARHDSRREAAGAGG